MGSRLNFAGREEIIASNLETLSTEIFGLDRTGVTVKSHRRLQERLKKNVQHLIRTGVRDDYDPWVNHLGVHLRAGKATLINPENGKGIPLVDLHELKDILIGLRGGEQFSKDGALLDVQSVNAGVLASLEIIFGDCGTLCSDRLTENIDSYEHDEVDGEHLIKSLKSVNIGLDDFNPRDTVDRMSQKLDNIAQLIRAKKMENSFIAASYLGR